MNKEKWNRSSFGPKIDVIVFEHFLDLFWNELLNFNWFNQGLTISDTNFFSSNNKKSDDIDSADAKISSRQNSILNPKMDHCFNEKDSKKRDVNSVDGSTLINDQTNFFDWIIDSSRFDSKLFNEMNFFHKISMIIKVNWLIVRWSFQNWSHWWINLIRPRSI